MKPFEVDITVPNDGSPAQYSRQKVRDRMQTLPAGRYRLRIEKVVNPKSNAQLGAFFGLLLGSAIEQANDMGLDTSLFLREMVRSDVPSGMGLTKGLLKEIFYCLCPMYRGDKRITLSRASKGEAAKFFTDCQTLLSAHGIYVPDPDPAWKDKT